ncbi:MAG TPA: porin [Pseudomonadales bacterium]
MRTVRAAGGTAAALLVLVSAGVHGGGMAITEHSAKGLGTAFASGGTAAEDASTQWFNPASMMLIGHAASVSASLVSPRFEYEDRGSVQRVGAGTIPLLPLADPEDQGGEDRFVPALFYVRPIGEDLRVGVGLNSPFGLATEYGDDWRGRYHALDSEVVDINLNLNVAYAVTSSWAVGGGVSVNYLEAELTNAIDFAAVCASVAGGPCPNGAVPGQGEFDGLIESQGDDVAFGFNLGVLWRNDTTRIGLAYRSELDHDLEGDVDFRTPTALGGFAALGPQLGVALEAAFADEDISAGLTLPDSLSLGAYHDFGAVALAADLTWYDWGDIPEVRIERASGADDLVEPLRWDDTLRAAVGMIAELDDRWTVRVGAAYDESPTPSAAERSARVPDDDRTWLSLGASYRIGGRWSVDVGYAHLLVGDTGIARPNATGGTLIGEFDSSANLLSVQVSATL